jgi:hypothetical protein
MEAYLLVLEFLTGYCGDPDSLYRSQIAPGVSNVMLGLPQQFC